MTNAMQPTPKMRADARRNRVALLAAAREVFAEEGADGPLEEIAARAGVGVGTLYRHFPDRGALLLALVEERWDQLLAEAERLRTSDEPPELALDVWLRGMVREQVQIRGLVNRILECTARGCASDPLAQQCTMTKDAMTVLLARGQEAGTIRADVTGAELFDLMAGVIVASERHEDAVAHSQRLLAIVLGGLRA